MRKWFSLLLLLAAANAWGATVPAVLVLGDSLSAGYGIDVDQSWPALLQARLETEGYEHRVVNASISGETTEGAVQRIDAALDRFTPAVVVIELGGNDGLRGFPPQRLESNLRTLIEESRAAGAAVALLGIRIPTNYGPRYTEAFEAVYEKLAAEYELPWIDFFMQGVALNDDLMQDDGIHPNAAAQQKLLDNAWPVIRQALEHSTTGVD
ncbi:MAG: arylesterase [Woeseiaceae bacterium]|nr:arylesterase [Woeseiaceae bacterium]